MKKNTSVVSLNTTVLDLRQKGINMIDLMMWIVIAALLLAAAIQGVGYYRESVILYYLKNDAIGAAANVKSSSAQDDGIITQPIVDTGLVNTKWSEGTTRVGKAHDRSIYSITAGNPEIKKSVVYCSIGGISVVNNVDLPSFLCANDVIAGPPIVVNPGDGSGGPTTPPASGTVMLAGWGDMNYHQLGVGPWEQTTKHGPFYQKTVTKPVSAASKACALADGVFYCWNSGTKNNATNMQESGVLAGKTITSVAGSLNTMCVVASAKVYCWGKNDYGQFGDGTTSSTATTVFAEVSGGALAGKTITSISMSPYTVCATDDASKLYCWGKNDFGQVGIGTKTTSVNTPTAVTGGDLAGKSIKEVSITTDGTCVLDTAGLVYCWGHAGVTGTYMTGTNSPGPTMNFEWNPKRVANSGIISGKTYTTINATRTGACAVSEGVQYCWGLVEDGSVTQAMNTPRLLMNGIPAGDSVIEADDYCARLSSGKVYCHYYKYATTGYIRMGGTDTGPLSTNPITEINVDTCIISQGQPWCHAGWGVGTQELVSFDTYLYDKIAESPLDINTGGILEGKKVTFATGGYGHSCVIADDEMYCFGQNNASQLGDGTTTDADRPVKVIGLPAGVVKGIATGEASTCALVESQVYCWGYGNDGFLGNGSSAISNTPVQVSGLTGKTITSITSGDQFVCATDSAKAVYCWGGNDYGQLGNGTTDSSNVPIAVAALAGKNVTQVSAGSYGVCALVDGIPNCWGNNWSGQFDDTYNDVLVPTAMPMTGGLAGKTVTSIASGETSFCALASDKKVYCWGANDNGEFGDGSIYTLDRTPRLVSLPGDTTKLVAGSYHICSLSGGSVYCWGSSGYGQVGAGVIYDESYVPLAITTSGVLSGKTITDLFIGSKVGFVAYQ